jgi:hypothetical protein
MKPKKHVPGVDTYDPETNGVFAGEDVNLTFSGDDAKAVFGILENLAEFGYITPAKIDNEKEGDDKKGEGDDKKKNNDQGNPQKGFVGPGLAPIISVKTGTTVTELTKIAKPKVGPGTALTLLLLVLTLEGDNVSPNQILRHKAQFINEIIAEGRLSELPKYVEFYYKNKKHRDEIIFRYISEPELGSAVNGYLPNVNTKGELCVKFVTPTLYLYAGRAKSKLALGTTPDYVIWTFRSMIEATLQPQVGWKIVEPANKEKGGGLEGTIFQQFPIMGVFKLRKE